MLMGKYQNSIDQKNRIIVPSKFREELGLRCVLTKGIDKCLYIYPMSQWESFMKKLSALPSADASVRAFLRHFYAYATECEIDKQGRITIPQELREYAGIQKEVFTMGIMDKIEIWSKEEWEDPEVSVQLAPSEFAQKMAEYGI
ncbi:MAG: division/cell wall cluster transcriptional repressor MraZ [Eubacteriales bacterium]|nr:division/cell wall cluster transcriptional repressor MraZ [Eubacteriales bacterium]MDD4389899.1 division/cell wall cluster transcriptional repressor MraZ [Eubacteriales bacterium]